MPPPSTPPTRQNPSPLRDDADAQAVATWLAADILLHGAPPALLALCGAQGVLRRFSAGTVVQAAGDARPPLLRVARGRVRIGVDGDADGSALVLVPGQWLGAVEAVSAEPAPADAVALDDCTVLVLDAPLHRALAERFEPFDLRLAALATHAHRAGVFRRALARLFAGGDAELLAELTARTTETTLRRGDCLMREGDPADAWYVLTSGRLGVTTAAPDGPRRGADLLPGASIGEIGLITGGVRTATIVAERDASLMRLDRADFERFADAHPAFARRLMGTVVQRLVGQAAARRSAGARILVLLPAADTPALRDAAQQLGAALRGVGAALLDRAGFEAAIGRGIDRVAAADPMHPLWNRFDAWLENGQEAHELIVLDAGGRDDLWQHECLQRADQVLWLAEPIAPGVQRPPEAALARLQRARAPLGAEGRAPGFTLLLAHPAETSAPRNTRAWLDAAPFERHLHLRLGDAASCNRTARLLGGCGIGLALSGGGARGFAHIGVLRAFAELGVPIDCIGGTSVGAIEAAQHAMGLTAQQMVEVHRRVLGARPFTEYTLPLVALLASRRRDACILATYGQTQIEDLWLPFLAVSADLNAGGPVVHERGSLALAVSASASLPGVLVPVVDGARVLVDGGILNNLPADLVKARCGGTLFASRVAPSDAVHAPEGGFPSAWSLLADDLLPWRAKRRVPRIVALLVRAMSLGNAEQMRRAEASIDVAIEPDVARWGMLQMRAITQVIDAGHRAGLDRLRDWIASAPEAAALGLRPQQAQGAAASTAMP